MILLITHLAPTLHAGAIGKDDAGHWWAFQPPRQPIVPEVRNKDWTKSPVDRFILGKLEEKGLSPASPADKRTLIRRATFDLTGLPPTPAEINAFLDDSSADAFARVVDRLLASSAYGERWGRHWLDVVRYADTAGDGADYPVREAFKYRNYVIDAFNADRPYNEFLREQLAGDILAADAAPQLYARRMTATGYIAVGKRFGYNNASDQFRHLDLADTIDVLGKSIIGLSIGCARCHDHKYDPVSMSDYYGLYGIFASSVYTFPGGEEHKRPENLVPLVPPAEREALDKDRLPKLAACDAKVKTLTDERTALNARIPKATPTTMPADRDREVREARARVAEIVKALADLKKQQAELLKPAYDVAYGVVEGKPANVRVQLRGDPGKTGPEVPRGFIAALGGQPLSSDCKQSGRLELADWLINPSHPLTAHVMVNRIWQYHFGRGIVATPSDFGTRGSPPSHPELLDWLALRFMQPPSPEGQGCGWSIKAMHRMIMMSAVYQMSGDAPMYSQRRGHFSDHVPTPKKDMVNKVTTPKASTGAMAPDARSLDPEDTLLWHFPRRRLEAEAIRDAMLFAAGTLDRSVGGEHPFPAVETWSFSIHNPFYAVYESNRRSVYLMVQRQKRHPFLALFDGADPNVSTDLRIATITPAQALFLMNSQFVQEQSTALAKRLISEATDDGDRIRLAFEVTQGGLPDADDLARGVSFLHAYREKLAGLKKSETELETGAWTTYARVLLTSNGFLYLD